MTIYRFGNCVYLLGETNEARIDYDYNNGNPHASIYYGSDETPDETLGEIIEATNGMTLKIAVKWAMAAVKGNDYWNKISWSRRRRLYLSR